MTMKLATLTAAALLAGAGLLTGCGDKSAQSADGAVSEGSVGTAANTPNGQVVPTGSDESKINAPTETAVAPAAPTDGGATEPAKK
jgi:hypothetical protein